mmetsp:Transcript_84582/g.244427  ORF Transcript_84582/g.244427 Transcript_84582/m.244427 type:complete len:482 (-) Transcript_84582:79-1524(-)
MQGPHNRAVSCPLCNDKFFPASLPFHQKQCEQRRAARRVNCPYCNVEVSQLDLPKHIGKCPKGGGGQKAAGGGGGGGHGASARGGADATRPLTNGGGGGHVGSGEGQFDPHVMEDGRMRCIHCGRYFNPDRIDKHQQICGGLRNARPKGLDGQPTQTARKVFDAEAQRLGRGPCFTTPERLEQKQKAQLAALQREKQKAKPNKWRREHEEFVAACRAGRGDETMPPPASSRYDDGKIQCPHCSRRFAEDAAERHIPICANVVNRAKPPPSPSPGASSRRVAGGGTAGGGHGASSPPTSPSRQARPPRTPQTAHSTPPRPVGHPPPSAATGRTPSAPRTAGGGAQAARSLRSSHGRLPGLPPPDRLSVTDGAASSRRRGSNASSAPPHGADPDASLDLTASPRNVSRRTPSDGGASHFEGTPRQDCAMKRVGLRRSAMLYRLLSHVPESALARELADSGVDVEAAGLHDREAMIEAILEELS